MQWNSTFFTVLDNADGAVEKVSLFIGKIHFFAELFSATLYTFKIVLEKCSLLYLLPIYLKFHELKQLMQNLIMIQNLCFNCECE